MDEATEDVLHKGIEYPFTQFVVCVGFLLVLIIENIAVSFKPADRENPLERMTPLCTSDSRLNVYRGSTTGEHEYTCIFLIGLLILASYLDGKSC